MYKNFHSVSWRIQCSVQFTCFRDISRYSTKIMLVINQIENEDTFDKLIPLFHIKVWKVSLQPSLRLLKMLLALGQFHINLHIFVKNFGFLEISLQIKLVFIYYKYRAKPDIRCQFPWVCIENVLFHTDFPQVVMRYWIYETISLTMLNI